MSEMPLDQCENAKQDLRQNSNVFQGQSEAGPGERAQSAKELETCGGESGAREKVGSKHYKHCKNGECCPGRSLTGLHKLWYPGSRDMSMWSKLGAHGEHGDVFLFSNFRPL